MRGFPINVNLGERCDVCLEVWKIVHEPELDAVLQSLIDAYERYGTATTVISQSLGGYLLDVMSQYDNSEIASVCECDTYE